MRKKKKWIWIMPLVSIAVICLMFLVSNNQRINEEIVFTSESEYTMGTGIWGEEKSFCDQGFFSTENGLMQFFDIKKGRYYTLCDEAWCQHNSEKCAAWFDINRPVIGVAGHNNRIYALLWNKVLGKYQLNSIQFNGKERKVIATLPIECKVNPENSLYFEHPITQVFYSGNYVWIMLEEHIDSNMQDNAEWKGKNTYSEFLCLGVNLETGVILKCPQMFANGPGHTLKFEAMTKDKILFCWNQEEVSLSEEEFYEQRKLGNYSNVILDEYYTDYYSAYLRDFALESKQYYTYFAYDIENNQLEELQSGEKIINSSGYKSNPYVVLGTWKGDFLLLDNSSNENGKNVMSWDIYSNEKETLFTIADGAIPLFGDNGHVTKEGEILFAEYIYEDKERSKIQMKAFSLEFGSNRNLYSDEWNFTYRIEGECQGYYVGRTDFGWEGLSIISKEDYEQGMFHKAKRCK